MRVLPACEVARAVFSAVSDMKDITHRLGHWVEFHGAAQLRHGRAVVSPLVQDLAALQQSLRLVSTKCSRVIAPISLSCATLWGTDCLLGCERRLHMHTMSAATAHE